MTLPPASSFRSGLAAGYPSNDDAIAIGSERDASVLVVDDIPSNAALIAKLLAANGFENVRTLTDPTQAMIEIREHRPDLLLLDLRMPVVDGFAILQDLKAHGQPEDFLPVMVLTADSDVEARHRALREGALDFLSKPLDLEEVLQRTRNLLRVRWMHEARRREAERFARMSDHRGEAVERMSDDLRALNAELEHMNVDGLMRLARAAELRDDDTGKHTERVGNLAGTIAGRMGQPVEFVDLLKLAARLHDVGKIGIPDSVLLKPGRLEDEERAVMEQHCEIGAALLDGSASELLQLARNVALTHHERWDGRGYPGRLQGEDIPLEGRIVAVADVFDALTHSRPYKRAWGVNEAADLIARESGRHFDPSVVDVFAELLDDVRSGKSGAIPDGLAAFAQLAD